jgi:D-3-phosphoglycerate dehydrogenase
MKVLVADKFEQSGLDGLKAAGCEVLYQPDLKDASLEQALRDSGAGILVVRSTKVTAEMFEAGSLALVVRAGAGYNTIDVKAASRRGVYVSNCPGKNAAAVAELTIGLMLALDRRIPDNVTALRIGEWDKKEFSKARGLYGRTLGLLGFGNIGHEVARRAHALGMPLLVWSRRFAEGAEPPADVPIRVAKTPADVAAGCDVLSVHLALSADTRGLVSGDVLGRLRRGSMFINTARAEVVDYKALEAAARDQEIRVGLDVYANEPAGATGEFVDPIAKLPNVYGTHHIGASTDQAQEAIAAETVRIVRGYLETGKVPNVVNLAARTPATCRLIVRHRDRPGVLAHVFEQLRSASINVQETENVIFEGAEAAIARINLDAAPPDALLKAMQDGSADVIDLHLVKI